MIKIVEEMNNNQKFIKDKELVASQMAKIKNSEAVFYSLEEIEFMLEKVIQKCEDKQNKGNSWN